MKGGRDIPSLVRAELRQVTREMEVLRVVLSRTDTGVPQNHAIARSSPATTSTTRRASGALRASDDPGPGHVATFRPSGTS
ncbi:MAG: hypothetical protein IPF87_14355 [Gemmatimonadetes bacterium]|jgi:hypothetical protein|nr:hypothetical protein [Gemmatimonadota bacterium]MBK6842441.1 hypothetical protein [Gemmatimonadota bacterium]MBK7830854.1 hypothetical protein [Gemmatimonadota bacterium]